ncbi:MULTISPECIES: hypothetical protein [Paenibacillus]|uniref:hypothetical protein n=1 Tax=Paenibacillus TaxID=44249 RepID=UPI00204030C0|nr:hypothetical protein [Paenibacillus camelliae]MCM3634718.1 hypothetical protein [Paenibacillus camelliae]
MKKKILWPILILVCVLIILFIGSNIKYEKIATELPGMYVENFIIEDGQTIPTTISEQNVTVEVDISLRKFFSNYKLSGEVIIDGTTHKIISSDKGSGSYIAALSSNLNRMSGDIKIAEDLQYFSIHLNDDNHYIIAPAQSEDDTKKVVNLLYGDR